MFLNNSDVNKLRLMQDKSAPNIPLDGKYNEVKKVDKKPKMETTLGPKKIISCNLCNIDFATVQFLSKHFLSGVHGIKKCKLCDKPFSSVQSLVQHFVSDDHGSEKNAKKIENVNNVGKFKFVPSKGFFKNPPNQPQVVDKVFSPYENIDLTSVEKSTPSRKRTSTSSISSEAKKSKTDSIVNDAIKEPLNNRGVAAPQNVSNIPTPATATGLVMDGEENHWIENMITKVENCLENCESLVGKVRDEWIDEISVITTTERLRNVLKFAVNNFKMIDKSIGDHISLWSKEDLKPVISKVNPNAGITCTPDLPEIPCTPSYDDYVVGLFNPNKKPGDKSNYEIKKELVDDYDKASSVGEMVDEFDKALTNEKSISPIIEKNKILSNEDKSKMLNTQETASVKTEIVTPEKNLIEQLKVIDDNEIFHTETEILSEETIKKQEEILQRMKQVFEEAKNKVPLDHDKTPGENSFSNQNDIQTTKDVKTDENKGSLNYDSLKNEMASLKIPVDGLYDKTDETSIVNKASKNSDKIVKTDSKNTDNEEKSMVEDFSNNIEKKVLDIVNVKKELLTPEKKVIVTSHKDSMLKDSPLKTNPKNGGKKLTLINEASLKMITPEKIISKVKDNISQNNSISKVKTDEDVNSKSLAKSDIDIEKIIKNCHSLQDYLKRILKSLQKLDNNGFFAKPVNLNEAPDYMKIIKTPMDFSTMKRKLKSLEYISIGEMETDFCLMIKNCLRYNSKATIYHQSASKIFDKGVLIINEIASAMEDSMKLSSKDKNLDEKKYNIRSNRSLNYSENGEESENEDVDMNAQENKLEINDETILPKLKIREGTQLFIDEAIVEKTISEKEENKIQRKLTRKCKKENNGVTEKTLERKDYSSQSPPKKDYKKQTIEEHKNEDISPDKDSKKVKKKIQNIKKHKSDDSSPVKGLKVNSEGANKKKHKSEDISSAGKKHKSGDISPACKKYRKDDMTPASKKHKSEDNSPTSKKHKRENISPASKKHKSEENSPFSKKYKSENISNETDEVVSEGTSSLKKSKKSESITKKVRSKVNVETVHFNVNKKLKRKKNKKFKIQKTNKKLENNDSKEKPAPTLQDVLSNTIEEKALEMLKNVLSKFTENGDKETKSGKKGNKKKKLT